MTLGKAYKRLLQQADDNDRWLRELELEQDVSDFVAQLTQAKLNDDRLVATLADYNGKQHW